MNIAVDLGGTNIRAGIVEGGRILRITSESTMSDGSEDSVVQQICRMLSPFVSECDGAIGIGVPGLVDPESGVVRDVVAIPSWKEVPLKSILEKRFSRKARINNDCNCFAMGESRYGKAAGVGCSLVIDGKIYEGANLGAGEIGNIPYLDKDYEYYCSSRFFESKGFTGKELFLKAEEGCTEAVRIWEEFGRHIGQLVSLVCYTYDPEIIVMGGSISNAFRYFEHAMHRNLEERFLYPNSLSRLKITTSDHKDMGLIGAAVLAESE